MKRGFILLVLLLSASSWVFSQSPVKKVAIMEAVDKEGVLSYGVRLMLRSSLSVAVTHTPGYEGYDRVDMSSIMDEQNFQRTGLVSDEDIRSLGQMTGASYILVAEVALLDCSHIYITAKLLDVETAKIENTVTAVSGYTAKELEVSCNDLASKLFVLTEKSHYLIQGNTRNIAISNKEDTVNRVAVTNMTEYEKRVKLDSVLLGSGRRGRVTDADLRRYLGSRYFEYRRYKQMNDAGIALVCSGGASMASAIGFYIDAAIWFDNARASRKNAPYFSSQNQMLLNANQQQAWAKSSLTAGIILSGVGIILASAGGPLMVKARNKMKDILQDEQEKRTAPVAELIFGPQYYGTGVALRF